MKFSWAEKHFNTYKYMGGFLLGYDSISMKVPASIFLLSGNVKNVPINVSKIISPKTVETSPATKSNSGYTRFGSMNFNSLIT